MQTINLTQNNFKMPPVVYMVQNDTGRDLKMILDDVTLDGTETGAVAIRRSDGSYYTITATLVAADNAFTIEADQALTQPGKTECQLKVTDSNNDVISSYTFIIMVQPSTDGISEEQLGYSVQQLRQDAEDIKTGGMPADLRAALLQIAQKVAYIDDQGAQYYQDLYDALLPSVILTGITAVYTQSGTVYDTDSLDDLKADLVVTASYSDGTTETLPASAYTLSGSLTAGTSTITVTYQTETATFNVTVTAYWDIEWDYTQGTPIGNGFEHSSAVTGSMTASGYQLQGASSGGCNVVLTDGTIGEADKGESEIVVNIQTMGPDFIGFYFAAKNIWGAIIQSNKLYYQNVPSTPAPSTATEVSGVTIQTGTDYTLRLVWDQTSGASLYVNGTLAYTITGALNGTNRTRWFVSSSSNATVALVKSMKARKVA